MGLGNPKLVVDGLWMADTMSDVPVRFTLIHHSIPRISLHNRNQGPRVES